MKTWDKYRRRTGLVIVLSGPSGVGKDCVLDGFVKECPSVTRCVTVTSRPPRADEQNGVDYHFVSVEEFKRMIEAGQFLEFAEVHENLYGTPKPFVLEQMAGGRDCVLKIDVQGGISVKKQIPDTVMIFLVPPSYEELERRLRSRSTESEADIAKRLLDARSEIEQIPNYNYIIENDSIEDTVAQLRAIVIAERNRTVFPH